MPFFSNQVQILSWAHNSISLARAILVGSYLSAANCNFRWNQLGDLKQDIYLKHSYQQLMY